MDNLERQHIRKNLHRLLKNTLVTPEVIALLSSAGALSTDDEENLETQKTSLAKAMTLYKLLPTRVNGYSLLLHALNQTSQSGAAKILEEAYQDELKTNDVSFYQFAETLSSLVRNQPPGEHKDVPEFRGTMRLNEIHDNCLKLNETFSLRTNIFEDKIQDFLKSAFCFESAVEVNSVSAFDVKSTLLPKFKDLLKEVDETWYLDELPRLKHKYAKYRHRNDEKLYWHSDFTISNDDDTFRLRPIRLSGEIKFALCFPKASNDWWQLTQLIDYNSFSKMINFMETNLARFEVSLKRGAVNANATSQALKKNRLSVTGLLDTERQQGREAKGWEK